MKRRFFYLVVAIMFLISCNKDTEEKVPEDQEEQEVHKIPEIPEFPQSFTKRYLTFLLNSTVPLPHFVDDTVPLKWHSDNNAVAVVDDRGYVSGLSEGIAPITYEDYNETVQDTIMISFINPKNIVFGNYTGILLFEDGKTVNTNSTMDMMRICVDGIDFGLCNFYFNIRLEYDGKKMVFYNSFLSLVPENKDYLLYGKMIFDEYPVIVNGIFIPENSSVNLKIYLEKENPVNLYFIGSIEK